MTRDIMMDSPPLSRRQPLLTEKPLPKERKHRIGEVAGGTAADCAAICCCPCALMHLVVLAVYKVPAALCRKAWRKQRRRRVMKRKKKLLQQLPEKRPEPTSFHDESGLECDHVGTDAGAADATSAAADLEKEMWDRFSKAGFWRSPSQRDN